MNDITATTSQSDSSVRAEWRPLAAWSAIVPQWRALAAQALEPNVFYEPGFALPAATVFGRSLGAVLVWSHADRLLGFFPARVERPCGLAVLTGWTHPYGPLGTPLVDRDEAAAVIAAWLGYVTDDGALPGLAMLPLLPEDGPFAGALAAVLERRDMAAASIGRHRRALLAPGDERAGYVEQAVGAKKRKELRRQRHRLADMGTLKIDAATSPTGVVDALHDFLELEARGWKGRAGTAAAKNQSIHAFIEAAVADLAADGKVRIDRLRVGGNAIAAAVTLRSGDKAWTWKIAYDEEFARASPGVQLMLEATESLLADRTIASVDSCATADHPMIDHLWRERLALSDRLIATGAEPPVFALASGLERLRRMAIAGAKMLHDRIKPTQ